jgi:hypothetical protein
MNGRDDEQQRPGFTPPPAGGIDGDGRIDGNDDTAAPALGEPEVVSDGSGRSRRIGTGVAVAAIGIAALGVAGATYAAASDPSPSPSGSGPGYGMPGLPGGDRDGDGDGPQGYGQPGQGMPGAPGKDGGRHGGFGMRGMGMGIHGSFVVKNPSGDGYVTVLMQRGVVTAVSSTSITVKSEDGYSKTYAVDADTKVNRDGAIADIKADADVVVMATESGSTATATRIADTAAFGKGVDHDGDGPGAKPSQSPTTSGTTT